jgi:hypothetical protein
MQRRTWLRLGLFGGAALALGGGALIATGRAGWVDGRLTPAGRDLFAAVARVVLEGLLPEAVVDGDPDGAPAPGADHNADRPALAAFLEPHLGRLEATVGGMPGVVQAEIAELTAVLLHPVGRYALTGLAEDWRVASLPELRRALQGLRESPATIRQQVFHALRDLTNAAHFADPSSWRAIGYPGPRPV